jgi:hypothetical protein
MAMSRRIGDPPALGRQDGHRALFALSTLWVFLVVAGWVPASAHDALDLSAYPWLYLREGKPLAAREQVLELIAVGDVMLGRGVLDRAQPLASVAPWLRSADLVLGNLECVVSDGGAPRPGPFRLRAPAAAPASLRDAGFDILGLANNHALDYGTAGLAETVPRLGEAGIATVGAGPDAQAASQPLIREVDGLRLAFLAFNAVPDPEDRSQETGWTQATWDGGWATAAITAARAEADAVVVSIHWGYEYELRADPRQREAAQEMLDAGADLVIGHHPHVVQGTEAHEGQFVAYSLGNLVFDQQWGETRQGLALRAFFDERGLRAVQALPVWAGPHPRLMDPAETTPLLARIQPPVQRTGFVCDSHDCQPTSVSQTPETGRFYGGAIDLTGDGVLEQVRLVGEQVIVYHDGAEVWRGLPEWRVADLALGDPNDDGRGEMLLALWKPDAGGTLLSHPFIVGYRGGAYRVLWGGSAATDPIYEVELGDVDGDGVQELIVLEERDGGRALTVWRWHGWGFSLAWRSPQGCYRDLTLTPGEMASPAIISVGVQP